MDITTYANTLRGDLARAADVGDEAVRSAAERLAGALDSSLRLVLMEALSDAAAEISAALPDARVDMRLQGREPVFQVTHDAPHAEPESRPEAEAEEGEEIARITFRLPERLKQKAEALASRRGQSLNTWLVNAARRAAARHDDDPQPHGSSWGRRPGSHLRGWAK